MSLFRVKATMQNLVESGGKLSMRQSMLKAGYSEAMANQPSKLTRSKTWQNLLDEYLPEQMLNERLKENILQKKSANASNTALDMAFKLRGKYQKEKDNEEDNKKTLLELEEENRILKGAIERRNSQVKKVS